MIWTCRPVHLAILTRCNEASYKKNDPAPMTRPGSGSAKLLAGFRSATVKLVRYFDQFGKSKNPAHGLQRSRAKRCHIETPPETGLTFVRLCLQPATPVLDTTARAWKATDKRLSAVRNDPGYGAQPKPTPEAFRDGAQGDNGDLADPR